MKTTGARSPTLGVTRWNEEPTLLEARLTPLSRTRIRIHSRPFSFGARSSDSTEHSPDLNERAIILEFERCFPVRTSTCLIVGKNNSFSEEHRQGSAC